MTEQNIKRLIYQFILQTFTRTGTPPSTPTIAAEFKMPDLAEIDGYLAALEAEGGIYRAPSSGVILAAYPFSATPTNHRVFFGKDRQCYAMCAIDALGIPFMLDTDATINSICPQCGKIVSINITGGQITTASDELVVVYSAPRKKCCPATEQCPYINLFCSPAHAQVWLGKHPHMELEIIPLSEALERGKAVFGNLFNEEKPASKV